MHASAFRHEILPYTEGPDGFLRGVYPIITRALYAGIPVLVAVRGELIGALREALGRDARRVRLRDMHVLGRNPARIIPAWASFLARDVAEANGSEPALGTGEPVRPGRGPGEQQECAIHEHLLNRAFDGRAPGRLLCPYDLDALGTEVIEAARRSHAFVCSDGMSWINDGFAGAGAGWPAHQGSLPAPPPSAIVREMRFRGARELARLRRFVRSGASEGRLSQRAAEDLVLAVNELATNSLQHGGGRGSCRMWSDGGTLLCEVSDSGHIRDPLAGMVRADPGQPRGRGLWVVNQLCELVQIRSGEAGTVVRIHARPG